MTKRKAVLVRDMPNRRQLTEAVRAELDLNRYLLFYMLLNGAHQEAMELVEDGISYPTYKRGLEAEVSHNLMMRSVAEGVPLNVFLDCHVKAGATLDEIVEARDAGVNLEYFETFRRYKISQKETLEVYGEMCWDKYIVNRYINLRMDGLTKNDVVKIMTEPRYRKYEERKPFFFSYILMAGGTFEQIDEVLADESVDFGNYAICRNILHDYKVVLTHEEIMEVCRRIYAFDGYAKLLASEPEISVSEALGRFKQREPVAVG